MNHMFLVRMLFKNATISKRDYWEWTIDIRDEINELKDKLFEEALTAKINEETLKDSIMWEKLIGILTYLK